MIYTNNTITLAVLTLAVTALFSIPYVYAQLQLPPGSVVIPPSQQHGPSLAQIQSDIAKHQQGTQYAQAMINLLNQRLGNNTSAAHAIQVLKQMTAEGKINCPTPFTNPGHCFLTPKPIVGQIAPPIG